MITTRSIGIRQFLQHLAGGVLERGNIVLAEGGNESAPRETRDLGGASLGDPGHFIPLYGCGNTQFTDKFPLVLLQEETCTKNKKWPDSNIGRPSIRNPTRAKKFIHPHVEKPVIISGNPENDALGYQQKAVRKAIEDSKS